MELDWIRTVDPASEPISLDEARGQCRVETLDEDRTLALYIAAARDACEQYTGRSLLSQTWKASLCDWPDEADLPMATPLTGITSVQYYAVDGTLTTWASTNYQTETGRLPGRWSVSPLVTPPALQARSGARVFITYTAGATDAESVPPALRQGLLLTVGRWFDHRDELGQVPDAAIACWAPFRVWASPPCE